MTRRKVRLKWESYSKGQHMIFTHGVDTYIANITLGVLTLSKNFMKIHITVGASEPTMKRTVKRILKQDGVRFYGEVRRKCK